MNLNPINYLEREHEDWFPDWYWDGSVAFFFWRRKVFSAFYKRREQKRSRKMLLEQFGFIPQVGDFVENCKYEVGRIVSIEDDMDTITMEDGAGYSLCACCSPVTYVRAYVPVKFDPDL